MTDRQAYMQEYNKTYSRSLIGLIKYSYAHQIRNTQQRKHPLPTYTEKELFDYFNASTAAMQIYTNWVASNYDPELKPSIDRLDNSLSYSLNNIEVVTWQENKQRAYEGIRNNTLANSGLLNNGHSPIVQYDFNGNRVAEYISLMECARKTGIDHRAISDACIGNRPTYKKFFWAYLQDEQQLVQKLTPAFLEKTIASYNASKGYLVDIEYTNDTIEQVTVAKAAALLSTSPYNIRQLGRGFVSNRSPKLPDNIKTLTLVTRD